MVLSVLPSVPQVTSLDPTSIPVKQSDLFTEKLEIEVLHHSGDQWSKSDLPSADLIAYCIAPVTSDCNSTVIQQTNPCDQTSSEDSHKWLETIDQLVDGVFSELTALHKFTAKEGKTLTTRISGHYTNAALIGIGYPSTELNCETSSFVYADNMNGANDTQMCCADQCYSHAAFGRIGKQIATVVSSTVSTSLLISLKDVKVDEMRLVALIESLLFHLHTDDRFKSKKTPPTNKMTKLTICTSLDLTTLPAGCESLMRGTVTAKTLAKAADLSRQLTSTPPNYCNPPSLAKFAGEMAAEVGLTCQLFGPEDLQMRNMGAFMAVGKGSLYPPHMIHLTYKSNNEQQGETSKLRRIAIVGKGVTMDTGGYNLKVHGLIELMKFDMGGGAAVLGAAQAIAAMKPKDLEIHFIVGVVENMISDKAYRPGDVVSASNGTTIEVGNTDAEGRLVLADCLIYAEKLGVETVVSVATLTGALMAGLGRGIGGVYGTSPSRVKSILKAANAAGEALWPMPLYTTYSSDFESRCADINNTASSRPGGSIHAALFLKGFIEKVDYCHIDMAGPTWDYKESCGTGYGCRLLVHYLCYFF